MHNISRRAFIDRRVPAETAIADAMAEVEKVGCDPVLTSALHALDLAFNQVADYVDSCGADRSTPSPEGPEPEPVTSMRFREFTFKNGECKFVFERDEAIEVWASSFLAILEEGSALNYMEAILNDAGGREIVVTVRYAEGKTPHQRFVEVSDENEVLRERIRELEWEQR